MSSTSIYAILSSKPHNPHYLNRYWKFIQWCQKQDNSGQYTENHHICPKSKDLFPEYSSVKIFDWNKIVLTARQHFVAHWILWKAYGGHMTTAFALMTKGNQMNDRMTTRPKINSTTYEYVKIQSSERSKINTKNLHNDRKNDSYRQTLITAIVALKNKFGMHIPMNWHLGKV